MAGSSTCKGDAICEACILHAGMLNLDIYETAAGDVADELKKYITINKSHWEKKWEMKNSDGFQCGFYVPKKALADGNMCPPVLVFRGSDAEPEDFAELAFATKLDLDVFVDKPWPASNIDPDPMQFESSFSSASAHNGKKMAEMDASGLTREDLFSGESGTETINISVPWWGDATVTVNWSMDAALFYGGNGDWAVDFAQGLGEVPAQYKSAVEAGLRAAADAKKDFNNQLIITGHSLGGGLASCAGIAIRAKDADITLHARTLNAAGLHKNTAAMAGGTLEMAASVPVRAQHVKDEILNSMQATSNVVPLLSHFLNWGGKNLPPAVAVPTPGAGISPGEIKMGSLSFNYAPKNSKLPVLYPLEKQKLCTPKFTTFARIVGIAEQSSTVQQFVGSLIRFLLEGISGGGDITSGQAAELSEVFENGFTLPAGFKDSFKDAILAGGTPPVLELGDTDYLNNIAEPFLNGLIVDTVNLAKIMVASGIYHTFQPCAFTFLLPGLKGS